MTFYLGSTAYLGSDAYLGYTENAQFNGSGQASATATIAGDKWLAHNSGILARGTTTATVPLPRTPLPGSLLVAVVAVPAIISEWTSGWYQARSVLTNFDMKLLVKDAAVGDETNLVLTLAAANNVVGYEIFEFPAGAVLTNSSGGPSSGFPALPHVNNADFFYQTSMYSIDANNGTASMAWSSGTESVDTYVLNNGSTDGIFVASNYFKDLDVSGGSWASPATPTPTSTGTISLVIPHNIYFAVATGGNVPIPKWVRRSHGTLPANGTSSHTIPTPSGSATPAGSFFMLVIACSVTNSIAASGWTERQQVVNDIELSLFTKDSASAGEASVSVTHNGTDFAITYEFFEFAPGTTFVNSATGTSAWPSLSGVSTADFLFQAIAMQEIHMNGVPDRYGVDFGTAVKKSTELIVVSRFIGSSKPGAMLATAWRDDSGLSSWTPTATVTATSSFGSPNYKIAVGLNVVEPAGDNARYANFNGSGTASAVVEKIGGDGGSTPEHSIYSTASPGTLTTGNDGQGITIGTAFYVSSGGPSTWRAKGARLYVPSGSALVGQTVTFKMWVPGIEYNGGAFDTPNQSKVSATLTAGWNEVYFDTPVNMGTAATQKIVIGYTSTAGNYLYLTGGSGLAIQASDGSQLYLSEDSTSSLVPTRRGWFRYANNSGGLFSFVSGIDVIVDEGAPTAPSRNAQFNGGGTASAVTAAVEIRTAQFNGSGTASASVVVDNTASRTATFNGLGVASALVTKVEIRNAQFNGSGTASAQAGVVRTIAQENALLGETSEWWTISGAGDATNLGFAREFSVNAGETINFSCHGSGTVLDIYRIGYYGGRGWRKVTTLTNTATTQPAPAVIPDSNGANTCTGWSTTASWSVPSTAVSGLYVGIYRNAAGNNASYIPFVIRQDSLQADIVIKTSDATWALAYNYFNNMSSPFDGKSVYGSGGAAGGTGGIQNRAFATTYHKPIVTRDGIGQTYWLNAEAPLIRWVERMGYNVKYVSSKDVDQIGVDVFNNAKIIISSGHDEYYSQAMRDAYIQARDLRGQHLLFMSGNEVFWRTRYTDNGDVMWCYKDTMTGPGAHVAGTALDPVSWTGTWKDTRPANNATRAAERDITGTDFRMNGVVDFDVTFNTGVYNTHPVWRNSAYAAGTGFTASRIVGFEADFVAPLTLGYARLCGQVFNIDGRYADNNGENYNGAGSIDWGVVAQAYQSGARVIGFGTCQWQWALDGTHDRGNTTEVLNIQQFQYNLFRDLGAVPETPHSGIVTSAPVSLANYGIADVALVNAQFNGSGTASAISRAVEYRTATFSGFGTASASIVETEVRTAQFNGEGTASAVQFSVHSVEAQFNGSGTASASVATEGGVFTVTADFSGSGTASAVVTSSQPIAANFSGAGQASASATAVEIRTAEFSGSGSASAIAGSGYQVTATFAGSGQASASISPVHTASAQFGGFGQASAIQSTVRFVTADFAGSGTASAYVPGASGSILSVGVWNGSVLVPATMTVWNGTTEIPAVHISSV